MRTLHWLAMIALTSAAACGGGEKKTESGASSDSDESEAQYDEGEALIPEEKFEEIKNTFERKATTIARCFPEAVEAGEVGNDDRIKLTVGLVVTKSGAPSDVKILGTTKRSETLEACVIQAVSRWEFTTLPRPLEYSYGFVLQNY